MEPNTAAEDSGKLKFKSLLAFPGGKAKGKKRVVGEGKGRLGRKEEGDILGI